MRCRHHSPPARRVFGMSIPKSTRKESDDSVRDRASVRECHLGAGRGGNRRSCSLRSAAASARWSDVTSSCAAKSRSPAVSDAAHAGRSSSSNQARTWTSSPFSTSDLEGHVRLKKVDGRDLDSRRQAREPVRQPRDLIGKKARVVASHRLPATSASTRTCIQLASHASFALPNS
jgi:hypothetical protein